MVNHKWQTPVGENRSVLDIVGVRMPKMDPSTQELVNKPLDIISIFAPTPLDQQRDILGNEVEGLDPSPREKVKASSVPYDSTDALDAADEIDFSNT